jgi:hypothetical protein
MGGRGDGAGKDSEGGDFAGSIPIGYPSAFTFQRLEA